MDIPDTIQSHISEWVEYNTEQEIVANFYNTIQHNNLKTFWDIGAYRGLYTLLAAEHTEHTYCFEPAPIPRENLHENCEQFNITNYTALSIPLYNTTEYQDLTVDTTSGSRTFIKGTSTLPERDTSNTVTRLVQRADELIKQEQIEAPDIVKIDIEGAEHDVLDGFGNQLSDIDVIFVEIHLSQDKNDTVSELLEQHGFSVTTLAQRENSKDDYQKFIKAEQHSE